MEQPPSEPQPRQRHCLACEQPIAERELWPYSTAVADTQNRPLYTANYHRACVPPSHHAVLRELLRNAA